MNTENNADPIGLIVPIDVKALCIGTLDCEGQNPPVQKFAGATTTFNNLGESGAYLGENVAIPFTYTPLQPLEKGVHLHWALPDALTKATSPKQSQNKLEFPPVPNRWLVTRYIIQASGQDPQIQSWVVESDALSLTQPSGQISVTLPIKSIKDSKGFAYLGRKLPFNQWPSPDPGLSIQTLTDSELTAVSTGVTSFASYYPDCRSVFGFLDSLDSLPSVQLMYVVIGWYSNPNNDPLDGNQTLADIEKDYQWSFQSTLEVKPAFTRYYGIIQGIEWDPNRPYITDQTLSPIPAKVAIGNSPSEVLSAYLRSEFYPENFLFEKLLHSFQKGKLPQFLQPERDHLLKISKQLHQNRFSMKDAGVIYRIIKTKDESSDQQELIDLPLFFADSLNELNISQQSIDLFQDYIDGFRSQLFADWYHIFKLDQEPSAQYIAQNATIARINYWTTTVQPQLATLQNDLATKLNNIGQLIQGTDLQLNKLPAPRYSSPNEPVIAITSDELNFPKRYGKDGQYHPQGFLVCRLTNQVLIQLIINGVTIPVTQFSDVKLPSPNQLPIPRGFDDLLQEACFLNIQLISKLSGIDSSLLTAALQALLANQSQSYYHFQGQVPSPIAIGFWTPNSWLPLFMQWSADFIPLYPTVKGPADTGTLQNYPSNFFNTNYTIDLSQDGYIQYTPEAGAIDLQTAETNSYCGQATLSPRSSEGLTKQLSEWSKIGANKTFQTILEKIQSAPVMIQSLNGFNNALLMRKQTLQLSATCTDPNYQDITNEVAPIIGNKNTLGIDLTSYFNPIRAGYLQFPASDPIQIVDVFGLKRKVQFDQLVCSSSMTTVINGQTVPSTAYLAPAVTQPARLLFRWIASDSSNLSEMNSHPATSPIYGWLLPNHLGNGSLFIYNQQGQALGTLFISGIPPNQTIGWQPAPGNQSTIDQKIEEVLAVENPQLRDFATHLKNYSPEMFSAILTSMDKMSDKLSSQALSSKTNLAVLMGSPIALTQAYLRFEIEGSAAIFQGQQAYSSSSYIETDCGFTGVQFPVVLGSTDSSDGLIGYYKTDDTGDSYVYTTFYTEASLSKIVPGVIQPPQNNLLLTSTPPFQSITSNISPESCVRKVLMLVDPRAQVHATMGIVPTESILIPPDQCNDALTSLEMSFLVAPTLITPSKSRGETHLALPLPKEGGFQWSWIEKDKTSSGSIWTILANIQKTTGKAISSYTPQELTEGWLRLNPVVLEFNLSQPNSSEHSLNLTVTNKTYKGISFTSGQLVPEGTKGNQFSIFYIHFGNFIAQSDIPKVILSALNWSFKCFNASPYGQYWAAVWTGSTPLKIEHGDQITFNITNALILTEMTQSQVQFDYYSISGLNDGVYNDLITIQNQPKNE